MNRGRSLIAFTFAAVLALNASALTRYVDLNSLSPTSPYTDWLTAATNIQDAVDAAVAGDTVLVTNGVYATGGRAVYGTMTNRVTVDKALTLRSVNGPDVTIIEGHKVLPNGYGAGAIRCVYLTNGATLLGFTLAGGATATGGRDSRLGWGAGLWCESNDAYATNCVITNCVAEYAAGGAVRGTLDDCKIIATVGDYGGGARESILIRCLILYNVARAYGGGAAYSTLTSCGVIFNDALTAGGVSSCLVTNCLIFGNSATVGHGGGAAFGTLNGCTIAGNSAANQGGGLYFGTLKNCILFDNDAQIHPNYTPGYTVLDYCCTTPLPPGGVGNITNAPVYSDVFSGNFSLQSNSPCINAGNNAFVASATDLDGDPRTVGGTVDIGAYEFQSPASVLSYAWAQQNGLPTDGSADFTDADGDGANNWQEWRADTVPTNATSALLMGTATKDANGLLVSWTSVTTRSYWLERGADLSVPAPFQTIGTNIPGIAGTKTYNDTNATNGGPYFYRVGVQ